MRCVGLIVMLAILTCACVNGQKSIDPKKSCGIALGELLDTRVVGGSNTPAENVPWNVIVERKKKEEDDRIVTSCGGNIISARIILTAAHCVKRKPGEYNVYVGRSSIRPKNQTPLKVKRIIIHELWDPKLSNYENLPYGHDIAILELEKELEYSDTVQPICLPNNDVLTVEGTQVIINGFGTGYFNNQSSLTPAEHLQRGVMEIKNKVAIDKIQYNKIHHSALKAYAYICRLF